MIDAENSEKKQEETSEDEDEPYEVIETPGASGKDLLSELISMDLVHRTPLQQIGIGGLSGWLAGTLCKKVGKMTMSAVGGGLFIIQVANRLGYIQINWKKVQNDMNSVSKEVEKEVYKMAKGTSSSEHQMISLSKRGYNYAKRNVAAAGGFVAGFLLGVAL